MTPFNLQEKLVENIKSLNLQSTAINSGFNVFIQNLPPKKDAKDDSMFPFCLITLTDGEQGEEATQDILFTFGVKDQNTNYQGYKDIVNSIEKVRQYLIKDKEVENRFILKTPIRWTYPDSVETYPFYFGAILATYTIPQITINNNYI